jgi:hypothetical protein
MQSFLQPVERIDTMSTGCNYLETVA